MSRLFKPIFDFNFQLEGALTPTQTSGGPVTPASADLDPDGGPFSPSSTGLLTTCDELSTKSSADQQQSTATPVGSGALTYGVLNSAPGAPATIAPVPPIPASVKHRNRTSSSNSRSRDRNLSEASQQSQVLMFINDLSGLSRDIYFIQEAHFFPSPLMENHFFRFSFIFWGVLGEKKI